MAMFSFHRLSITGLASAKVMLCLPRAQLAIRKCAKYGIVFRTNAVFRSTFNPLVFRWRAGKQRENLQCE
jgi:hypothetical protein